MFSLASTILESIGLSKLILTDSIDLESVPKLISKPLKEKIKYEAQELNFLRRTSRAKIIF